MSLSRSLGEIGRLGSSLSKQMDAEVTSINSTATKETTTSFGGFALSAPNLFGNRFSAQRHGGGGSGIDHKLGEDSNGSSDPDLAQTNKVGSLLQRMGYVCNLQGLLA